MRFAASPRIAIDSRTKKTIQSKMGFVDFLNPYNNASDALPDLINNEDWKLVVMESKMKPKDASIWTLRDGFFDGEHASRVLPIHQACALRPPREVIDTLFNCYPQGLRMGEDTFKRLPLHVACQTNAPLESIKALIQYYPEATRCKDSIGRLPIHYACAHDTPSDIIAVLLRAFPASTGCMDNNGWLPLHVACRRGLSLHTIRLLLDSFPQSADMLTKKGSTPIMCARKGGNSQSHLDIIGFIEEFIRECSLGNTKESNEVFPLGTSSIRHRHVHAKGA